jgi:hypothetical protein
MNITYILHVIITLFTYFGFLIAPKVHAPVCGAIVMHWITNNNRCFLSKDYEDENGFTKELLAYVGIPWPKDKVAQYIAPYLLLGIPMIMSVILTNM